MSCMWCVHFKDILTFDEYKDLEGEEYVGRPGHCTLNPEWVKVTGLHFCSHHTMNNNAAFRRGTTISEWWLHCREQQDRDKDLSAEVRRLKAANKSLREKLRSPKEPSP